MKDIEQKIIQATLDLFVTRQYDGMTIPMIAKAAHIGVGTVYNYFENKESLVNAIYRNVFADAIAYIRREDDRADLSFKERFDLYYKRLFEFSVTKKNMILFLKYNSSAYYISPESKDSRQGLVNFLVAFLAEGKAAGFIKDVPQALYMPIIYAPIEMLVTNAAKNEVKDMSKYADTMLEFTWNALKA